jgi:alanine racemase
MLTPITDLHPTKLVISKEALFSNISVYKDQLLPSTKIMVMIKAFGYGSGDVMLARLLEDQGIVDYLGVAYISEGVKLRDEGILLPIMVMNTGVVDLSVIESYNMEITIHSPQQLAELIRLNKDRQEEVRVHIKFDSGMHRLGFHIDDIKQVAAKLLANNFKVVGTYTHLAASPDSQHDDFTHEQFNYFDKCYTALVKELGYKPMRHVLNSAGIIRFPDKQYEMVRAGMGVYGIDPAGLRQEDFKQVSKLVTKISQINHLKKGDTVGYVREGKIETPSAEIAILPVGYADGYNRLLSNGKAEVYVNGKRAPIIGNVCMDMTFINITGIPCKIGDEVELFGPNIDIQELAEAANTIDYEVLTSISPRVVRVYE